MTPYADTVRSTVADAIFPGTGGNSLEFLSVGGHLRLPTHDLTGVTRMTSSP